MDSPRRLSEKGNGVKKLRAKRPFPQRLYVFHSPDDPTVLICSNGEDDLYANELLGVYEFKGRVRTKVMFEPVKGKR